ncbi:hypothetical protein K488DRAFT_78297 [Vararia minispora EC-137]|uniref:Uncharacterized protein n=1 Tax=Vararia minispora EC-137 TaxID=1314806 RepID=A0ACB8QM44_9AGAM|nr:hypothetical protein K488DRAFT_78297 [Vararia minispora EC-137]
MSDPRFARLKTDPRFRKPKKQQSKVIVDDRFKSVFDGEKKARCTPRVDKYGRRLADDHDKDNLRRFYRLENEDPEEPEPGPDYARGEVLLESSDEGDDQAGTPEDDDSDLADVVTLGGDPNRRAISDNEDAEVDLDESNFADLDAQAAAYSKAATKEDEDIDDAAVRTRRLAVVNLDWDHVRAVHLYKIFESVVSSGGPSSSKSVSAPTIRGKVLSVRIYPSRFGKERMEREERAGPPAELFTRKRRAEDEEINEKSIYETGDADEYDQDALRKYQLERLRYYYAVVECDTPQVASHLYSELQGTELERSANVFDMSFIPDEMEFDDDFRDEAQAVDMNAPYKGLDFTTDALRHSRVKLTWDQEDPERSHVTRRDLTKKEIEDGDFHAYIAPSSGSELESVSKPSGQNMSRDKLRALLLGDGGEDLPEGWGNSKSTRANLDDDVDMEVTFMPALSGRTDEEETTLGKYQRKVREKKKKRKEEWKAAKEAGEEKQMLGRANAVQDDFFGESGEESETDAAPTKKGKRTGKGDAEREGRRLSTKEELSLLAAADGLDGEAKHFDMKAIIKAEKGKKGKKSKRAKREHDEDGSNELQGGFSIDVMDERFQAVHEDYHFAIDPSNPHFKRTKSMAALLEERSKRQQQKHAEKPDFVRAHKTEKNTGPNLHSLVESVKRKSSSLEGNAGKRQRT